jgi:Protein of unknown function (DUF1236)/YMGG-like Gly-zipper
MLKREESSWQELDQDWEQQSASDVFQRLHTLEEDFMNLKLPTCVAVVAALSFPMASQAQNGAAAGATTGAVTGAVVGGPVGAAVGAGVGAVAGGIADDSRPRFRSYVSERHVPSYRYEREVRVGEDLPSSGVTYYEVPREYGVTNYRYTVVNDRTVLVDPSTHRIVQVIE